MRASVKVWAAVLLLAIGGQGIGQVGRSARFAFVPVPHGTWRLDTHTGAVSFCANLQGDLRCRPVDRSSEGNLQDLEKRISFLEARLRAREGEGEAEKSAGPLDEVRVFAGHAMQPLVSFVRRIRTGSGT